MNALNLLYTAVAEIEPVRYETCHRIPLHIQQIGPEQLPVKRSGAGVDRPDLDRDIHMAGTGDAVKEHRALHPIKTSTMGGRTKVINLEAGKGVGRVEREVGSMGMRRRGKNHRQPHPQRTMQTQHS